MVQERISIIIPVHNAEPYLAECLQSIVSQDYKKIELILVDDGTSGDSHKIYKEFSEFGGEIKVLEGKTNGPADARNRGLEHATGEYIAFIDADDYLPGEHVLSKMLSELQEKQADIIVGNYERLWNGRRLLAASNKSFSEKQTDSVDFRFGGFFSVGTLSYVWGKIYRASFLKKHRITFRDYSYAEDKLFSFQCYIYGAKYGFIEDSVYVYRKNDTSISHGYRADSIENWMGIARETKQSLIQTGTEDRYGDLVAHTIFFAAFFDGKMNYEFKNRRIGAVKEVLKTYGSFLMADYYFKKLSGIRGRQKISSAMWRFMIFGFALGMRLHLYTLLGLGIKLLVDLKIDEKLSDTGKRE